MEFDFVFPPPKGLDLDCSICFGSLYIDPYQNIICGHHFCDSCAYKLREEGQPCPVCRQPLNIIQDLGLQRTLKSLQVYCNNKDKGCQWEGELGGLQDHYTDEHNGCLYSEVHCTNNCGYQGLRHTIRDHMESDCPYRPMRCEYCEYQSTWEEVTGVHVDMCQLYPVTCVCGIVMTRTDLTNHKGNNCPNDKIECEFADYLCEWEGERQQLHDHLQANWCEHLELVTIEIKADFDAKTDSLHNKVYELEEHIVEMEATIKSQKKEIELLETKVQELQEAKTDEVIERLVEANVEDHMASLENQMKETLAKKWTERFTKRTTQSLEQLKLNMIELSERVSELEINEDSSLEKESVAITASSQSPFPGPHHRKLVENVKSRSTKKKMLSTKEVIQVPVVLKNKNTLQFVVKRWRYRRDNSHLHKSPMFYFDIQCKMQVIIHCNGCESGEGSHVSVYACVISSLLRVCGDLVVVLHNQISDDHLVQSISFDSIPKGKQIGIPKFVAFEDLAPYLRSLDDGLQFELPQIII